MLARKKIKSAELSRRMALLWGDGDKSQRGPKPALTLDRIVQRATAIADQRGLHAVTMQNVAARLGVTTMALYRYVASKSELIDAMVETALGKPPAMPSPRYWRASLATWAKGNLSIYQRHPWVLHAIIASPPFGPNQLAWLEAALNALSALQIRTPEKMAIISLVDDHVRGCAQFLLTFAAAPELSEWYARAMQRASADDRYPTIAELVAAGAFKGSSNAAWNPFEFGLERVLDGIEAFVQAQEVHRKRK